MYESFRSIATTAETQEEFKDFFQAYHNHLQQKLDFPPLKVSKALHAAAEVMNEESWHHLTAKTQPATDTVNEPQQVRLTIRNDDLDGQLWALTYVEADSNSLPAMSSPQYFLSEQECITELWSVVRGRMFELELWETLLESIADPDYEFLTDDEKLITKMQSQLVPQLRDEVMNNERQWELFENGTYDINNPDMRLEVIEYYFNFMDGDGIVAAYDISPVNLTKRS